MGPLLDGHVAVVTGGGSGIGRAIAEKFASDGAAVVIADLTAVPREGGVPTHERITDSGGRATFVECDVADPTAFDAVMEAAESFGGVSVMVNNAGIFRVENFLEVSPEEYDQLMNVNARGTFFGAQAAAKRMVEAGRPGSIINMASTAGLVGNAAYPTYCASKGAIRTLTYALADALGPAIRVNAIHPGAIDTEMSRSAGVEAMSEYVETIPAKRIGLPADIAEVALFLASDRSSYVTGSSIIVDGGSTYTG